MLMFFCHRMDAMAWMQGMKGGAGQRLRRTLYFHIQFWEYEKRHPPGVPFSIRLNGTI
jgi:hypothetical protein